MAWGVRRLHTGKLPERSGTYVWLDAAGEMRVLARLLPKVSEKAFWQAVAAGLEIDIKGLERISEEGDGK